MKRSHDFLRFFSIPLVLIAGIVITLAFTVLYASTARTPEGKIIASRWPRDFTMNFSRYIYCEENGISISDDGLEQLRDNGLWLQVLDAVGTEIIQVDKPADAYAPYALLHAYQTGIGTDSVFVGNMGANGRNCTYLIGFPLSVSKISVYVDNARYQSGKVLIVAAAVLTAVLVILLTVYSYQTFDRAQKRCAQDEEAREVWLTHITHDLKTPLSPIVGYAELLVGQTEPVPPAQAQRYGGVILKNARYAEALVDDLRLTYQLKSGMLPLHRSKRNITGFVREIVIDLLNAPGFAGRQVSLDTQSEGLELSFDPLLMKRVLTNVLTNALIHSGDQAAISVTVAADGGDAVLTVFDNGSGMTQQELDRLFTRYYRGESTQAKPEGSGLGMAIAKQIVEAHGGTIQAHSKLSEGTEIIIRIPEKN